MQQGRSVSLAKAAKVVFGVLRQQDWFRKNSVALLKELKALSENKEVPHAEDTDGAGAGAAAGR